METGKLNIIQPPFSFLKNLPEPTIRFISFWFIISLIIHLVTATFSLGFHHWDEHFQLLEFAGLKLGKTTAIELPWEYPARIRPTLQPYIALYTIKLFGLQHQPFTAAMVLRYISALLGWFSISVFTLCVIQWFKSPRLQKGLVLLTTLLWFLPYIHVRFSSESWSGSFFFLGLSTLFISQAQFRVASLRRELGLLVLAGLLFGFSYVFRMQSIVLLPGIFLWYLLIGRMKFYKLVLMGVAVLAAIFIGVLLDYSFYGTWVNTALRYFEVNILEGKAASFGVDPWWYYFKEIYRQGLEPIGLIIIAGVVIAWLRYPKNILTWATLPFFVLHCMVSHKELRFIFPMANAVPVFMMLAVAGDNLRKEIWQNLSAKMLKIGKWVVIAFFAYNLVAMLTVSVQPVRSEFRILQYFNKNYYDKEITVIGYNTDPYESYSHIPMNFYRPPHFHTYRTNDINMINFIIKKAGNPVYIYCFNKGYKAPPDFANIKGKLVPEYSTLPFFLKRFDFNNWVSRTRMGLVYRIEPTDTPGR